ncbi:MAG: ATP-dependent helicase, partial [Desulfurococcaceae archaeon]
MTNIFKVRKWLEDDEFKELLKIADYLGFENGYKLFKLNIDKALRNGYTPVDVRNLIEEYADEAEEAL